ncbi:electron transfer flavoprotein subunit beta/FixA family protein, partial [Actinacidiphila rubida]|uniref:electron transfer flavoprotein subunit beta/FixA family protein n=1 Tax=Actinacidiphila rubida TaxID=310780 RepID=UPI000B238E60
MATTDTAGGGGAQDAPQAKRAPEAARPPAAAPPADATAGDRRPLHTVALVKQVPLGDHPGTLDAQGRLRRDGFATELNPWCRRAVTRAVELGAAAGGRTTVITMGPPAAADVLREALACGADEGLLVSDPELAGADCLVTAKALAAAVRALGPVDLVLVGRSTVDGGTGTVGPMVAELLGLPFAGPALTIDTAGVELEHHAQRVGAGRVDG